MHLVDEGQRLEAAVWGEEKGGNRVSHGGLTHIHTPTLHSSSTCLSGNGIPLSQTSD